MLKNAEEFGQSLQKLIDRHRQDLSILLGEFGITGEISPAFLVELFKRDPEVVVMSLANLDVDLGEPDFYHAEGESTLDKIVGYFKTGIDLINQPKTSASTTPAPTTPEPRKIETKTIIIVGVVIVVVLTVVLIVLRKRK